MDTYFACTECGKCCNKTKIPLTVAEALAWLRDGHPVQVVCDASPWPAEFPAEDLKAAHRRRRSFAALSGSLPIRVVAILVANNAAACPNLQPNQLCRIYERRPLVCRIYPSEMNPFMVLDPAKKACPPEAWGAPRPLLVRGGVTVDPDVRRLIQEARDTEARETQLKRQVCAALNLTDCAVAEEGFVVHSPAPAALEAALIEATQSAPEGDAGPPWRLVSNSAATVEALTRSGAGTVLTHSGSPHRFQYLGFKPDLPAA